MDEDYLDMARLSNYGDYKKLSSLDWLYQPVSDRVEEFRRVDDFEFDAQEFIRDLAARVDEKISKKAPEPVPLHKKPNLTLAETVDLFKKGYKPYVYCSRTLKMVELTMDNEEEFKGCLKEWLLPMMADKINERYDEITRLEVELHQHTVKVKNEIEELHERIQEIKDKGTDLIF